jgi:hypothetical protein
VVQDSVHADQTPRWFSSRWGRGLIVGGVVVALAALWPLLRWYIDPQSATERWNLVLAWATIVAGVAGIGTLYAGFRNTDHTLRNTREVEEGRAREQALQSYLENIGRLLAEGKLRQPQSEDSDSLPEHLVYSASGKDSDRASIFQAALARISHQTSAKQDERQAKQQAQDTRTVARAQTLTVLQALDPKRKRIVVQFLYEAELIYREPIVRLSGADLRGADLRETHLRGADLWRVDLRGADLWRADLREATLCEADLRGAFLKEVNVRDVDLGGADLRDTHDLTKNQVEAAAFVNQQTKLPFEV